MYDYEEDDNKDMCPICKTDRYLSPDLKFLVNPECYHRICESCVDRIFSLGPAQCPYPNCDKILRKNKFKTQIFADVNVEKEVDIRKRVFNVFNKTLADFNDDLDKYNEYLEEVEDMIYKLDHEIDVDEIQEKLKSYEAINRQIILSNIERNKQDVEQFKQRQQFEKDIKLKKKLLEKQIEEEDRQNKEWAKREIVNRLTMSNGVDSNEVINSVKNTVKLKKSSARRKLEELNQVMKNNPFFQQQQQQQQMPQTSIPFTPFNGDRDLQPNFQINEDQYSDPFTQELIKKKEFIASGFRTDYVFERLLTEAFMGLGCYISEEKA